MKSNQITAKVVAHSVNYAGGELISLQLQMPRMILPEFNTHRAFSRSTASNRAIPTVKLIEQVRNNPFIPVSWGKNQAGMVAAGELSDEVIAQAKATWLQAAVNAANTAEELNKMGLHKQVANRVLEPFMMAQTIVTATSEAYNAFFKLRLASDAQPEIQTLAREMREAVNASKPQTDCYHLPYITEDEVSQWWFDNLNGKDVNMDKAYALFALVSAARCARVSYNNHDQSNPVISKDLDLAHKLLKAKHMSPFEHQAYHTDSLLVRNSNFDATWQQFRKSIEEITNEDNIVNYIKGYIQ